MQFYQAPSSGFKNFVLRSIGAQSVERLRLHPVPGKGRPTLTVPGRRSDRIFFLEAGYVSIMVPLANGTLISAGMLGSRSIAGASALFCGKPARHFYELPPVAAGDIYAANIDDAQREFDRSEEFRAAVLNSLADERTQAIHLCACNALHDVEQRISRWLLLCHAELDDRPISCTHEIIASSLGICRSTATMSIDRLQRDGILYCSRGQIRILDLEALEKRACECYAAIRDACSSATDTVARKLPHVVRKSSAAMVNGHDHRISAAL